MGITREQVRRGMTMPLLVALFGVGVFFRIPGAENVRPVQILSLIAVGMGWEWHWRTSGFCWG